MKKVLSLLVCGSCLIAAGAFVVASAEKQQSGTQEVREAGQRPAYAPVYETESLVEVIVGGIARDLYDARGRRYVEALRGEEYELRIRNPYPVRVAVALSVDGLNTIDARRTSRWDSSKWLIEPYQMITISGWQMSREQARRFYFTRERDSYAAKLGRASDLGVISAVFFRERSGYTPMTRPYPPQPAPRSQDERERSDERGELQNRSKGAGSPSQRSAIPSPKDDDYASTGIGRGVRHDVRWVNVDLDPRPAAEITIRYEYRDALVRLGVLPRMYPPSPDPLRRRERAKGFEDQQFCPEP
jgi:hypothetical protein